MGPTWQAGSIRQRWPENNSPKAGDDEKTCAACTAWASAPGNTGASSARSSTRIVGVFTGHRGQQLAAPRAVGSAAQEPCHRGLGDESNRQMIRR